MNKYKIMAFFVIAFLLFINAQFTSPMPLFSYEALGGVIGILLISYVIVSILSKIAPGKNEKET